MSRLMRIAYSLVNAAAADTTLAVVLPSVNCVIRSLMAFYAGAGNCFTGLYSGTAYSSGGILFGNYYNGSYYYTNLDIVVPTKDLAIRKVNAAIGDCTISITVEVP